MKIKTKSQDILMYKIAFYFGKMGIILHIVNDMDEDRFSWIY